MEALWLEAGTITYRPDLPVPQAGPGEALIRMRLAGICSTDLELVKGYYPYCGIPGHEFVGEVVQVGSRQDQAWVGQRVAGEINLACGECRACRAGRRTHCERRRVLGIKDHPGAFAEYIILPTENLHRVPDSVPDEAAVFTEPLAAALEILEQVKIGPADQVLLVGAGRLGQLVARVLALTGCRLAVAVRSERQSRLLHEAGIPTLALDEIRSGSADLVVEATGSPEGFALARRAVRARGILVLKSTYKGDLTANFSSLVVDEITLLGSRCGPFPPALRLLEYSLVDPRPLIEQTLSLAEGGQAFNAAAQPGTLKILLRAAGTP